MACRNLELNFPNYSEYSGTQPTSSRKVHFNDKQSESCFHFELFPESHPKDGDRIFINDHIKLNDGYLKDKDIEVGESRMGEKDPDILNIPQTENKHLDVQTITLKLKQSYENIDRDQDLLKKISKELNLSKNKLMCHQCAVYNKDTAREVDRLIKEVESLQNHFQSVAKRKKKYLEELALLQVALHRDRTQMEASFQESTDSKQILKTKLDESSKVTRDQRKMIYKLKSDNIALWKLLQEVQEHLRNEHQKGNEFVNEFQASSENKQLSDITAKREVDIYKNMYADAVTSSASSSSLDIFYDGRVSNSSSSSTENGLSEKIRHLIAQTEHIKQVIPNIENHQHEFAESSRLWGTGLGLRDCRIASENCRIPSENEKGMRSDMNDIMSRCEDLEKKVDQCSTKDIREILMHQLHEIDQESSISSSSKENSWKRRSDPTCIWNPEQHQRAREDILQCLDKISLLERNFNGTQEEVRRLRNYIKETAEEKEFCEKTYKREAMDLRKVVENKSEEIERLKEEVKNSLKLTVENQKLKSKIEKLEKKLQEKTEDIAKLVHKESETRFLKTLVEEKNSELENLKLEMQTALDRMERFRLQEEIIEDSNKALKSDMKILQERNDELRASIEENIQEELALLQSAILEAERRMDLMKEENNTLKQKSIAAEASSRRGKFDIDDVVIVNRLKRYEEELQRVNEELRAKIVAENENEILLKKKDSIIRVLTDNLSALNGDIFRESSPKAEPKSSNDIEFLIAQLMTENKRLAEEISNKDMIIDDFRNAFLNVAAEWDQRVTFEPNDPFKENIRKEFNFDTALTGIKDSLKKSHYELVDKVAALHKELKEMKEENRTLKKQKEFSTKDSRLKIRLEKLNEENDKLRDLIDYRSVDEVKSALCKENDRLFNENSLLRTALNEDRKELVDSNLRKRDKIKLLEQELKEKKKVLKSNLKQTNENLNFSRDIYLNESNEHVLNQSKESKVERNEPIGLPPKSKKRSAKQTNTETSSNEKAAFAEMIQQNEIIRKLQEDNERLRMNATTNKEDKKEIEVLKSEREKLKLVVRSNEAFEEEVNELKKLLKEKNRELIRNKEITSGYEKEITFLRGYSEGLTPTGSPEGKHSSFKKSEKETLLLENAALKSDLDKALKDIEKLIEIVDRRKLNLNYPLNNKKSVSCNDITTLDHESKNVKKSTSKLSLDNSMTEITSLKHELTASETSRNKAYDEIGKLKATIHSFRNEKDKREYAEEEKKQKQVIEELKNNLEEALREKRKIISQSLQDKITFEEKINSMFEEISKLKEEKTVLEDHYNNVTRIENTKENDDCNDWFQNDLKKRFSLLSPDDYRGNISDRKHARDHGRLIRKLQVENQTLRTKMLTLEEEGVETIKIVADMERGHGHLTGTLRTHLVLQKASTAKLLEGSIEQYAADFENFKRKFKSLEIKYDRDKKSSKRRDHAWDLFTNASASITNIHNILNEGFFKFEEDLEKDLDEEFVNKDYKSRLWIMRRQLSDVEKRHREQQLRAEELNLRLHAKTAEYEVTQEELEDTTRDLESRDSILHRLKKDAMRLSKENQSLSKVIKILQENEEKTIKEVIMHNTALQSEINELSESHDNRLRDVHANILEMSESLEEKQKSLSEAIRLRDLAKKETEERIRRIQYLEKKLHEMTEQKDKLKKEAENRAGYMAKANEDHGTIHLLRDDLKKLAKENADMKQELAIKQRLMYDMSKDLHKLRLKEDGKVSEKKMIRKEDEIAQMQHEISELKTEKFILETKVKDLERKKDKPYSNEVKFLEKIYRNKLVEKEAEIQEIKNEITFIKSNQDKKKITNEHLLDQDNDSNKELLITYKMLQQQLKDVEERREIEIKALRKDIHQKRRRISDLLKSIEELKQTKSPKINEIEKLVENVEIEEQQSLLLEIDAKERETEEWKKKTYYLESELRQARSALSASSCEDDKFKKVYLNKMLPYSGSVLSGGYFDRKTPGQDSLSLMSKTPEDEDTYHKQDVYDPNEKIYEQKIGNKLLNRTKSNENIKKTSKIPQRRLPAPKKLNTKLRHAPSNTTGKTDLSEDNENEDDPELSFDKVNNFLHEESNAYRNTLGVTEHNHLYDVYAFSRLKQNVDKLTNENTMLKVNLSELKVSLKKSFSGDPKVATEKNLLLIEENKSLKELLETQTQNVSSQERVIKALKSDMDNCKSKYIEHCDRISEELKEKKREVRNLKKNVKELQINNKKVIIDGFQDGHKNGSCNEPLNQSKSISNLFGDQNRVEELEKKLTETENTYEDVLKQAEKALEDAKHKLTVQHQQNKELTKKVNEIRGDNQLKEKYFEELKTELTEALAEKNKSISFLTKEYQDYKRGSEEEYNKISKHLRELEKQCQDYKILLENSESTTSEFVNHSKYEIIYINDDINGAKGIESFKSKYSKPRGKYESLVNTLEMISDDRSLKTDMDEKKFEHGDIDYEIEYEILKGCNEELEKQVFNLENKLKENENTIKESKIDYVTASMKLEHALNQIDTLDDHNRRLEKNVRELEQQAREFERSGVYNFAFHKQSLENTEQIEQLKGIVGEYEVEMHRSDTMLKKEKSVNKKSIEEFIEITRSLEETLNNKNKEIEMLKYQSGGRVSTNLKINNLRRKIKEKQEELNEKDKEISNLESQLQKWILKSMSESYNEPKTLFEQSTKILDMSNDSVEFKSNFTESFKPNVYNELNKLKTKNSALQLELNGKCEEIEIYTEKLNNYQEELKSALKMQEELQSGICKKENDIHKLKHLLKHGQIYNENLESFQDSTFSEEHEEELATRLFENEEKYSSGSSKPSDIRNENKTLIKKLYKVEQENTTCKTLNRQYKEQLAELKNELHVAREKINQLRSLIYENSTDDLNLKIKSKVFTAFEELREKSIEIAELNLKLEIQSQELNNLKACSFPDSFEKKSANFVKTNIVESEIDDQELIEQNIQLRSQLISKSQHCDFLQEQIFKLVNKVRGIEKNLLHENEYLKEKYIFDKNIPEQTDVTEVTPLGNTFTLLSKKAKDDANETILLDGFEEFKNEENGLQMENISHLQDLITQNDNEKSRLKEENNELKLVNNNLMKETEVFIKDIEQQRQNLSKADENIKEREEAIKCLQTQLLKANNKAIKLENELRQINKEKQTLLEQLEIQRRRNNDDIMNAKSTFLQVKEEHINSLKEELASTIEEKLKLQVVLKEHQLDLKQKDELVNKLTKENKKIDFNLKMKEEEMDELVNALSLLEAENIRLVDCLNMRVR